MNAGEDMFNDPFAINVTQEDSTKMLEDNTMLLNDALLEADAIIGTTHKKKKKRSDIDKLLDIDDTIEGVVSSSGLSFDDYLDNVSFGDAIDDTSLKRELTSLGRKFARENALSNDESEISKAFSPQELYLKSQLDDLAVDLIAVQKDIEYIRGYRTKNYKALSELMQTKNQLQTTCLNVVKAINDSKKVQIDLKAKDKAKDMQDSTSQVSARALKSLFSMNRKAINDAVSDETSYYSDNEDAADSGEEAYYAAHCNEELDSDGDKFIKYENVGPHYVLIVNEESDMKQVITEDKDGNIIPDYPLPTDIDDLDFNINYQAKSATDQQHRSYVVRIINEDGVDE